MRIIDKALHLAAAHDKAGLIRPLLCLGANPYATNDTGQTAFNCAASNGLRALHLLTQAAFRDTQKPKSARRWKNYDLNTPSGRYGSTLITYAAKVSPAQMIAKMIRAGADITIINGSGWTLLHCAAVMPGRKDALQTLAQAFRDQGHDAIPRARTTHPYETTYNGHRVLYDADLSAAELCQARRTQDPHCPEELAEYAAFF